VHWTRFLADVWPVDAESIETLQEFMGLALTPDTSHQKIMLLIGPPRSGKGTINRVLQKLVGEGNYCSPTLSGLGTQFGSEPLIGKRLAVITDARLSTRVDPSAVAERLLSISGEDAQTIDRKHRSSWTAKLSVRFLIMTNELPALLDSSGAFASRFRVLQMTRSFLGNEDRGLASRLLGELPGILNWSLEGLDRLRARGYLRQPKSAAEAVEQLETISSPIRAFVKERCEMRPGASVECGYLFNEWLAWNRANNREQAGTRQIFGRNLLAAYPQIGKSQPRVGEKRERHYEGIALRPLEIPR
jgi:putative DNA primase/helicase